ncbi:MAG: hypothetical protein H6Q15_2083 [Bacteroidetes bacterium]|nr:hypothetical protein [Bacteroidota bacterium]
MSEKCEHKWVFMESICKKRLYGTTYERIDLFFCEKCLGQKQTKKEARIGDGEPEPDWYKK